MGLLPAGCVSGLFPYGVDPGMEGLGLCKSTTQATPLDEGGFFFFNLPSDHFCVLFQVNKMYRANEAFPLKTKNKNSLKTVFQSETRLVHIIVGFHAATAPRQPSIQVCLSFFKAEIPEGVRPHSSKPVFQSQKARGVQDELHVHCVGEWDDGVELKKPIWHQKTSRFDEREKELIHK